MQRQNWRRFARHKDVDGLLRGAAEPLGAAQHAESKAVLFARHANSLRLQQVAWAGGSIGEDGSLPTKALELAEEMGVVTSTL
jgi:hypothetical protein